MGYLWFRYQWKSYDSHGRLKWCESFELSRIYVSQDQNWHLRFQKSCLFEKQTFEYQRLVQLGLLQNQMGFHRNMGTGKTRLAGQRQERLQMHRATANQTHLQCENMCKWNNQSFNTRFGNSIWISRCTSRLIHSYNRKQRMRNSRLHNKPI